MGICEPELDGLQAAVPPTDTGDRAGHFSHRHRCGDRDWPLSDIGVLEASDHDVAAATETEARYVRLSPVWCVGANGRSGCDPFRPIWGQFRQQFQETQASIETGIGRIEDEADLAEKEVAKKERVEDEDRWRQTNDANNVTISYVMGEDFPSLRIW